jgi:hypothetical protein
MDTCEVPLKPGEVAGVTVDPYADPCQLVDIHSATVPFHNYRQIHIGEVGFFRGYTAKSRTDNPQCPPLWQDCQHYWDAMWILGYEAGHPEERSAAAPVTGFLTNEFTVIGQGADWKSIGLKILFAIGGALIPAIPAILKVFGIA